MENNRSTFQRAFTHLYFLMLSADKIADLKELKIGNKIMSLENLDKAVVMKDMDLLSSLPREKVFDEGVNILKTLSKEEQLKTLGYLKLIAKVDGSYDEKESDLLNEISLNNLQISLQEIAEIEVVLKKAISEINDQ